MNTTKKSYWLGLSLRVAVAFLSAPLDVHLRPGTQFRVIAQLGNWAEVLGDYSGWYLVQIPQGGAGWVDGSRIDLSAGC